MPDRKHRAPRPCPPRQAEHRDIPKVRNRDPNQRRREVTEETMAEGRESRDSTHPYHHRQPYVRPTHQYNDHRTYEPRAGTEGRHPHLPERPVYSSAKRMVRNRDPYQRRREVTEETMAEGRESRDSTHPYHHRQPYVRPTHQYNDHRTYEPRPRTEGRQPHLPERPVYSSAKRMVRDRDPNQRGRDVTEETMGEGRGSRYSSPPGGDRSSPPTPQQYRHRQPYVRPTHQYNDHRTYEPRAGTEGRHPHLPERPVYSSAKRMVRDRDPNQRGRDVTEETMGEGRGSRYSSPPGGDRSSPPTSQQYRHRQPYVRPTHQYNDHCTYEPRAGTEGRHPHLPERPVYSSAKRMVRDRDPNQRGRDVTEETMGEGRGSRYSSPPGGDRSSPPTSQQYRHRQPYVRPTHQYNDHRTYEPRAGTEGRHPHLPERPVYSGAKRMVRDRDPNQRGRDVTEETMGEGRGSRYSSPPGRHRFSPPTPQQHSKRPGKQTGKAVDPTTQPILRNKKGASDTKPGPVYVPKQKQAAQRSPSPGLVKPEAQAQKSGNPWKPAMRRESVPADQDSHITQDLFKKVLGILNKLTPQKFIQLRNQLLDLTIKTEERLKGIVDLLFEKAINEPSFLVTYAKMCCCLATVIVPTADDPLKKVNFHKLLLSRCQKELQTEKVDDVAFETRPKVLDSAASTERDRLQVEPEEAKDITRRRSIGNIKLICELFKLKMLNKFIVHDCLDKLLRNNDQVALECFCILLRTISKGHTSDETKMEHYMHCMKDIVTEGKTSSRIRYMLEDTIDTIDLTLQPDSSASLNMQVKYV